MLIEISRAQIRAFDEAVVEAMAKRLCRAVLSHRPDLSSGLPPEHKGNLHGFMAEACEKAFAIGLSKFEHIASFAGICLSEPLYAPLLPRLFGFIETVLLLDEPEDMIMSMIDTRLARTATESAEAADLIDLLLELRNAH
jgi:hypothetical protein